MVGGRIIEKSHWPNFKVKLWCVDSNDDECAVMVEEAPLMPELGQEIWWQSGKVYFNNDKNWLIKVGNSFDPSRHE